MVRDTHGQYQRIGEIYGFPISIISEKCIKDGVESVQNRFVVEGQYKYKFNNGYIAMSNTHAAGMNFLNAIERIPGIIEQHKERKAKAEKDVPALQAIVAKVWGKEDELKDLKAQLTELDKKITATLTPKEQAQVVTPVDAPETPQQSTATTTQPDQATVDVSKKSMVAEPTIIYRNISYPHHSASRTIGL